MRFFVPAIEHDPVIAEAVYGDIRSRVAGLGYDLSSERIYAIAYTHNGKLVTNRVGEKDLQTGEEVFAIFRGRNGGPLLVCTPPRGVTSGGPLLASHDAQFTLFDTTD